MQAITLTIQGGTATASTAVIITREIQNAIRLTLVGPSGSAPDLSGIAGFELGISQDFKKKTVLLAATSTISVAGNVLTISLNGNTEELADFLDNKKTTPGYATLKGFDSNAAPVYAVVFSVFLQNVGYDADAEVVHAIDGLVYTKAQTDAKFAAVGNAIPAATEEARGTIQLATAEEAIAGEDAGKAITPATLAEVLEDAIPEVPADLSDLTDTTGILAAKEAVANKTQEIDAVTPSADKYTSEAAVVAHVAGLIPDVPDDLSDLADATGILAGKVDKDGDKVLSDNNYTDADAAKVGKIELETLAELTGADATIAPWTQSKWSASGTCSLTASGWATSGHQIAYIVITLAAEATPSIIGTEEVAEDDALSAAGVYECYIKNVDGKKYFRVISFTEAAS